MINFDDINRSIGSKVRAARAAAGLSRKRLAQKADVSERYLSQLETGEANVSVGVLGRVADALGHDLVSMLPGTGKAGLPRGELVHPLADVIGRMSISEQQAAAAALETWLAGRRKSLKGIALLGLRGAGKSTIGGLFAAKHGLPFLSVTREIESKAGLSLNDLFNLGGPDAYRTLENEVVREITSRADRVVLETAGGIVSNGPALDAILGNFKTVWLKASPEEHLNRVIGQGDMRPMKGTPQALEHLKTLLAQREEEYGRADCVLDTTGLAPEACVDELDRIAGHL